MGQPAVEISMLEAAQLFNGKPPAEWTAEELAAFRARLQQTPGLLAIVGGKQVVERRLAEVEAALAKAREQPAVVATPVGKTPQRKPLSVRRIIEVSVFVVLLGTAGYWLYHQLRVLSAIPDPDGNNAVASQGTGEQNATEPGEQGSAPQEPAAQKQPPQDDAVSGPDTWRGWALTAEGGGKWLTDRNWDLSNPGKEAFIETLTLADGTVRLSKKIKLAQNQRWLEIRARPQTSVHKEERVLVQVNGEQVGEIKIGNGASRWPAFVSLEKFVGQPVELQVVYEAGGKGQQIAWRNLEFVPQKREIAKRINCGGPTIESTDGDWEADDGKSHLYLTSSGTRTFTLKEPAPGTGDMQQMHQDERWANQYVEYTVPVEPGAYDVVLHFAETNKSFQVIGKRQFNIIINNLTVAEKFDIFKAANGPGPHPYRQRVEVTEGPIEIRLQGNPTGPAIKGIEILKLVQQAK